LLAIARCLPERPQGRVSRSRFLEDVSCRDTHAVNEELLPDYPVNYICRNADDQIYAAVVTPDGVLTSLSGPARLSD